MENIIKALRKTIADENWYGALFIALSCIDICSKYQYPNVSKTEKRFVKWYDHNLVPKFTMKVGAYQCEQVFLTGEDLYALRCSILHEGTDVISHQPARRHYEDIMLIDGGCCHMNSFNSVNGKTYLQLRVQDFVADMLKAIEVWYAENKNTPPTNSALAVIVEIYKPGAFRDGISFM